MAKKRARKTNSDLEAKAAEAIGQLANAFFYMQKKDRSAEMQRNFRIVEKKVDRTWNKYQDSLVSDAKKNRRQP